MSNDGAFLGVTPERALRTILGGEPAPGPDEQMTPEAFEAWVRGAPTPESLVSVTYTPAAGGYDEATRAAARCILEYIEATPEARESFLAGEFDPYDVLKETRPAIREIGYTGFMWGYATNVARRILGMPPAANPAIVEL